MSTRCSVPRSALRRKVARASTWPRWGAFLVALKNSVEVATQVVSATRAWLRRTKGSTQTLKLTMNGQTLELSAATVDQQQQLVDAFVVAVATPKQT